MPRVRDRDHEYGTQTELTGLKKGGPKRTDYQGNDTPKELNIMKINSLRLKWDAKIAYQAGNGGQKKLTKAGHAEKGGLWGGASLVYIKE